jgi:hypothetical protein
MKTATDEHERKALTDIKTYGVHIVHVLGDEDLHFRTRLGFLKITFILR